jgi:hypothetical protein
MINRNFQPRLRETHRRTTHNSTFAANRRRREYVNSLKFHDLLDFKVRLESPASGKSEFGK